MADVGPLAGSRAVLVGVSAYEYAEFPPIRSARNSLEAVCSLLADPALCAWPPEWITVIANPISAAGLATQIADLAESTTGVLLLYYAGHGVLSASGELCLTVTSTRPDRPKISGLPWETLGEVLRGCPATVRLAILDCCFAGQATETLASGSGLGLADIAHVEGVYTLAATTRNRAAHVLPPGQQDTACTSFTGELRDLIHSGIPGKAPRLTFTDIYPVLRQRLRGKGLPVPSQRGTGAVGQFYFSANAAVPIEPAQIIPAEPHDAHPAPQQEDAAPVQPGQSRHDGLVTDALRAAHSITSEDAKAQALVTIADAVASTDPARAGRLTDDAERLAQAIPDPAGKAAALAAVVQRLAPTDPGRAERLAQAIPSPSLRALALAAIADAVAATDPDRNARVTADAERLAQAIPGASLRAPALAAIAKAMAATNRRRADRLIGDAEHLAQAIPDPARKAAALAAVVQGLAATDADHAERLAQVIVDPRFRAPALAAAAKALATTHPSRAK
jgi:hypothetical protein